MMLTDTKETHVKYVTDSRFNRMTAKMPQQLERIQQYIYHVLSRTLKTQILSRSKIIQSIPRNFCYACIAIALMYPPNRRIFLCSVSPIQDIVNLMSCCSHEEARLSFNGPCCKVLRFQNTSNKHNMYWTYLYMCTSTVHVCTWT
jgi:hypothetical protein